MGGTDFKWGARAPLAPRWQWPCVNLVSVVQTSVLILFFSVKAIHFICCCCVVHYSQMCLACWHKDKPNIHSAMLQLCAAYTLHTQKVRCRSQASQCQFSNKLATVLNVLLVDYVKNTASMHRWIKFIFLLVLFLALTN